MALNWLSKLLHRSTSQPTVRKIKQTAQEDRPVIKLTTVVYTGANPTEYVRATVASYISSHVGSGITVYPEWPHMGPKPPCVVMQHTTGHSDEMGEGQIDVDTTKKGYYLFISFQISVFHTDGSSRDQITDKILHAIWDHRLDLENTDGIEVLHYPRMNDMGPEEIGKREYSKVIEIPFKIKMTGTA